MKTATVRQVQHGLANVIAEVQKGREIAITKHGKIVARILPAAPAQGRRCWPDSAARMDALMGGKKSKGTPASAIVRERRGERL
jgi:prevent-host-death family protein